MKLRAFAIVAGALCAVSLAAQPGPQAQEWAAGPVSLLMTEEEKAEWKELSTDEEAEIFGALFWARRDPDRATPVNEYRQQFEQRVAFADREFKESAKRGAMTDRGRVLILLGPPSRVARAAGGDDRFSGVDATGGEGGGTFEGGGGGTAGGVPEAAAATGIESETWTYHKENLAEGLGVNRLTVTFRPDPGTSELELVTTGPARATLDKAAAATVVDPDVTAEDLTAAGAAAAAGPMAQEGTVPGSPTELSAWKSEGPADATALSSLEAMLGAEGSPGGTAAALTAAAFRAGDGTWIVPVQVSVEPEAATGEVVLFGEIAGEGGETSFRRTGSWEESTGQRYVQQTLVVPGPGTYQVKLGLADAAGKVLWAGQEEVVVPAASDEFWLSELLLSDNVAPMAQAQEMYEPFAWEGIKVVPMGSASFAQGDVLWYYVHACHPTLDEQGQPDLRVIVELAGPRKFRGPMDVQAAKAGTACWVIAQALDLQPATFVPGDYELKVQVSDVPSKATKTSARKFKVVEGVAPAQPQ